MDSWLHWSHPSEISNGIAGHYDQIEIMIMIAQIYPKSTSSDKYSGYSNR